jgi:hypothetical protein
MGILVCAYDFSGKAKIVSGDERELELESLP